MYWGEYPKAVETFPSHIRVEIVGDFDTALMAFGHSLAEFHRKEKFYGTNKKIDPFSLQFPSALPANVLGHIASFTKQPFRFLRAAKLLLENREVVRAAFTGYDHLYHLSRTLVGADDATFSRMAKYPEVFYHVRDIYLHQNQIQIERIQKIANLAPFMEKVALWGPEHVTDSVLQELLRFKHLSSLTMHHVSLVTDEDFKLFLKCKIWKKLDIRSCRNFTRQGIVALSNLKQLEELYLTFVYPYTTERFFDHMAQIKTLRELYVDLHSFEHIEKFKRLPYLQSLTIEGRIFEFEGIIPDKNAFLISRD